MSRNNFNNNEEDVNLNDFLDIAIRRWKILFLFTLSSILISIPYSLALNKIWEGNFQIVLKKENNDDGFLAQASRLFGQQLTGLDKEDSLATEVAILESPSVLQPVFKLAKELKKNNGENVENFKYDKWLKNSLNISLIENTSVLQIKYRSIDKDHILPILEKISTTYQDYSASGRENYLKYEIEYAEKQLDEFRKKSKLSNREFDLYGFKYGISSNSKYKYNGSDFQIDTDISNIIRNIQDSNELPSSNATSPLSRLSEINQELIRRKQLFKDNDPSIKSLIKEREFLKKYIETTANGKISLTGDDNLTKEEAQNIILKYNELKRDANRNNQIVNNLESNLISLKMSKAKKIQPWKLISIPNLQDSPVAPKKKIIVGFSTLLGFFVGFLTASYFDKRKGIIYNFDEFEKFSSFPIFHRVNSKDKFEIETHQKLLIDTFSNENKPLGIISIGKFKNNYLEFYKSSLKEFSKEKSWIISDNLLDTKDYPSILIIANLGVVTKSDLGLFIDQLKLQEKKVLGSILINSKAN